MGVIAKISNPIIKQAFILKILILISLKAYANESDSAYVILKCHAFFKTFSVEEDTFGCVVEINYPQLFKSVHKIVDNEADIVIEKINNTLKDKFQVSEVCNLCFGSSAFSTFYSINFKTQKVLSIKIVKEQSGSGFSRPFTSYQSLNINLTTGEILRLEDILSGNYKLKIIKYIEKEMDKNKSNLNENFEANDINDLSNFLISPDGLLFFFQGRSSFMGFKEILIPYKYIEGFVNPAFLKWK